MHVSVIHPWHSAGYPECFAPFLCQNWYPEFEDPITYMAKKIDQWNYKYHVKLEQGATITKYDKL